MKKVIFTVFSALFFLSVFLNVSAQSCSEQPVTIEHHSIHVDVLYGDLQFDVYVPPCMDERISGAYPAVYLLHGQDMGIEVWQEMEMDTVIRDTLNTTDTPLFLTVVPQEDQYLLSLSLSGFEEAVLYDLIPWIEEHYPVCKDRLCRSIGGFSRGAIWAEKIAFEHPELFGSVELLSMPGTFTDDQSLYYISERHDREHLLRIRMDVGAEDSYRHEGSKAASQLTWIGYPYEYYIQPGDHDTAYWRSRLTDLFVWFSEDWKAFQSSVTIAQTAE